MIFNRRAKNWGLIMKECIRKIENLEQAIRIKQLKKDMLDEQRYASIEQARIITKVYRKNEDASIVIKRALSLYESLKQIDIRIDQGELIVGNRTAGVRAGVIFPESGISWVDDEIESLYDRPQDKFKVKKEDIETFRNEILPYWKGKTLEDKVAELIGEEKSLIGKVAKINQTDHAQGHICPNTEKWLTKGPRGLLDEVNANLEVCAHDEREFYQAMKIALEGAVLFIGRYAELARQIAENEKDAKQKQEYLNIAMMCEAIQEAPAAGFREAVQSAWFLFVILQMESNASSFSPGRMDQYLLPYFQKDLRSGEIDYADALEIIECIVLKFNQIVYLRSANSAKYFAGFPIGFNVAVGGQTQDGKDATNELSYLFLKAQEHLGLPQPNLSARVFAGSPYEFLRWCARVIGKGSGMPQLFNDEAVIPALMSKGIKNDDAYNYAIVGCVELTTHGNALGWSDAAMFNLVKALELALNDGVCLQTGKQMGAQTGTLVDFDTYADLENAFEQQIDFFFDRMIPCCEVVEKLHCEILPSAFLSSVIDDCIEKGIDVTGGGAKYNLSGIQAIQPANIADSLAAIKKLVFDEGTVGKEALLKALREDYNNAELLRLKMLNKAPKYGNDVEWVDEIAHRWIEYFSDKFNGLKNARGGIYHTGLYTVSAHVPMGANVGATADGRKAGQPLADGGLSAVYGRDINGPTAHLKSVSKVDSMLGSNGTLLNMKFSPDIFKSIKDTEKFIDFLKAFIALKVTHVQFNVITKEELIKAQKNPEQYKSLTIRVAGYTAYFTELAPDLQDEIIARTCYDGS